MVRWTACGVGLWLLGAAAAPASGRAQAAGDLPATDQARLVEVLRVANEVRAQVWPGWERTILTVLLVTDSLEFLLGHPQPSAGFANRGYSSRLGGEVWTRARQLSPTLLATFPAVGAVPTIVVGSAVRTGKSSTAWILTVLHEHFHQWQYGQPVYYPGVARLDLARGNSTGQWMLDYPFPYDTDSVQRATHRLALALARALKSAPAARADALAAVTDARGTLRRSLTPADYRYLEFQLWQEGVARFIEYAVARAASRLGKPSAEFRSLPDYVPYEVLAEQVLQDLGQDLERLDLRRQRRVAFYSLGAAMALLLDEARPDWKRLYVERPFALADFSPGYR